MRSLLAVALLAGAGCVCDVPPVGSDAGTGGGVAAGDAGSGGGQQGGGGGFVGDAGCTGPVPCYDGPDGTQGIGACHFGQRECHEGALGPCMEQVKPLPELCNGIDDDCNGVVDDLAALGQISCGVGVCRVTVPACTNGVPTMCVPRPGNTEACGDDLDNNCDGVTNEGCGCVYVSPLGNDAESGLSTSTPVRTIAHAIALAITNRLSSVCVGSGGGCLIPPGTAFNEAVEMQDGISLQGGYDEQDWNRYSGCYSMVQNVDGRGVHFGPSIHSATAIEGLQITGANGAGENAAITIEGASGVTVTQSLLIGGGGDISVGVRVLGGAAPVLYRDTIESGTATSVSIGVESVGSKPLILDNCPSTSMGRCSSACNTNAAVIHTFAGTTPIAVGVRLEDSPGAVVSGSGLCVTGASQAIGVLIEGDANGTVVRASDIEVSGGTADDVGVLAQSCAGASPWVFNNAMIAVGGPAGASVTAAVIAGDCPARIDSNGVFFAAALDGGANTAGVHCLADDGGVPSRCIVSNTGTIDGPMGLVGALSVGVQCDPGACALIQGNFIDPGFAETTAGIVLVQTDARIARNNVRAGCPTVSGVGLVSIDSSARVENNEIWGLATCSNTAASNGVRVVLAPGPNEIDLNSNTISGAVQLQASACSAAGIVFGVSDAGRPDGPRGLVRNNIVSAGTCATGIAVIEETDGVSPRAFENNDLVPQDGGLYLDDGMVLYTSIYPVNVLKGSAANISADPRFDGGMHLTAVSPCRNAGTPTGAPSVDYKGIPRPQEGRNDIGADEYMP